MMGRLILLIGWLMTGSIWSATFYVTTPTGDPTEPGSFAYVMALANADPDPETTIAFHPDLGIIYLNDSLVIEKPMQLVGPESGARPIISGNNSLQGLLVVGAAAPGTLMTRLIVDAFGGTGIYVNPGADGCQFRDMQISNGSGIGIRLIAADSILSNMTIFNMAGVCVSVEGPRTNYTDGSLTSYTGWGIIVYQAGMGSYFENLYMEMANIIGDAGITLKQGADHCQVKQCLIVPVDPFQNNSTALVIESNYNRVTNNVLRGGLTGVRLGQSHGEAWNGSEAMNNMILGCHISGHYALVFGAGAHDNQVQGYSWDNLIRGDWQSVVMSDASTYANMVIGSTITGGDAPVIFTGGTHSNTIYANSIQEGSMGGVVLGIQGLRGGRSNTIKGNEIGVHLENGKYQKVGNQHAGVRVTANSTHNLISQNIIGGQATHGVWIRGFGCSNNRVLNNFIGMSHPNRPQATQALDVRLGGFGILLRDTSSNVINKNTIRRAASGRIGNFGGSNWINGIWR